MDSNIGRAREGSRELRFSKRTNQRSDALTQRAIGLIPVLNEVDSVTNVVRLACSTGTLEKLVFVDDGSSDGTREALRALQPDYPQLHPALRPF